jgi:hypothetical protein
MEFNKEIIELHNKMLFVLERIKSLQEAVIGLQERVLGITEENSQLNSIIETFPELYNNDEGKHLIKDLYASARLRNTLSNAGYIYLEDIEFPLDETSLLYKIDNFGKKTLYELKLLLIECIGKAAFGDKKPFFKCEIHHYDYYLSECGFAKHQVDLMESYIKMTLENKSKEMINEVHGNYLENIAYIIKTLKNYMEIYDLNEEEIKDFFLDNKYLISYFSR